ncbi:succinate dehydrogenase cytochrome b560 subunit, mitochondrial isoform X3 [Narcine bancroftii]|uniref:succinate dehydrogenase cytochrome b560 subunit, mitochondrial isoform X3 n=1 Tax=Narcine bancroftii TaxID=1343680 RepID=UPI0038313649
MSRSAAGSLVTDMSDEGQAGTFSAVARENWLVGVGCWVFPPLCFVSEVGSAVFKGGCCPPNCEAPRCTVGGDISPLAVVKKHLSQASWQEVPEDFALSRPLDHQARPEWIHCPAGDGPILAEEPAVEPTHVPSPHHLQVVTAHGHVGDASWDGSCPQFRSVSCCPGCLGAAGGLCPLPGTGA